MKVIKIKPHHLLDILKLHGKGRDIFVPDEKYGHDFYRVANDIVNCDVDEIIFTKGSDDICKPCRFNKNSKCTDNVGNTTESKELHNLTTDKALIKDLEIIEDKNIKFIDVLDLLKEKLNHQIYKNAWSHANEEEIEFRYKNGLIGLGKVISKYNDSLK